MARIGLVLQLHSAPAPSSDKTDFRTFARSVSYLLLISTHPVEEKMSHITHYFQTKGQFTFLYHNFTSSVHVWLDSQTWVCLKFPLYFLLLLDKNASAHVRDQEKEDQLLDKGDNSGMEGISKIYLIYQISESPHSLLEGTLWNSCEQHVKTMWTEFTMWNILWNKIIFLVQKMTKRSTLWNIVWNLKIEFLLEYHHVKYFITLWNTLWND